MYDRFQKKKNHFFSLNIISILASNEVKQLKEQLEGLKKQRAENVAKKQKYQQQLEHAAEQKKHLTQILEEKSDQLKEEGELLTMLKQTRVYLF